MEREYYSLRNKTKQLNIFEISNKFVNVYRLLSDKDYFKEQLEIEGSIIPKHIELKAAITLDFQPFPIAEWDENKVTEDNIFDTIEYLYDHVSKPGERTRMVSDTNFIFWDYENYDIEAGKEEYREYVNNFLSRYRDGYELTEGGQILSIGSHGVRQIIMADLPILGNKNIDSKVQNAILKWRNRQLSLDGRKEAIRDLADVFEWLKKSKKLAEVLNKKDESLIFEIVNKFAIRHHNPDQIQNYDKAIWYSWIFHFYLATFHAVSRMQGK